MKCSNCGYISSREFYRCPYCGHTQHNDGDLLKTRLKFGSGYSIRIRTIVYGLLINLFAASILVDWFLNFKYSITLWSFIVCLGSMLLISIIFRKKGSIYSVAERIDIFVILTLILGCGLATIKGVFDIRPITIGIVFPAYLLFSTLVSVIALIFGKRGTALRPIITDLLLLFHALLATVLFVFLLVNKYSVENGITNPAFSWMQFGMTKGQPTPLYIVEEILVFGAFGATWGFFVNYNFIFVGFIYRKVANIYGGSSGD